MSSRRTLKAAEAIREVVSMAILKDLKDPRIDGVTVTHVEVSPDMRQAKVHVSIMGDDQSQRLCLHGLQSAAGFLQTKVAKRIDARYTPRLRFELDMGVKKSIAIARLLDDVLPPSSAAPDALTAEDFGDDERLRDVEDVGDDAEFDDADELDDEELDDEALDDADEFDDERPPG